MSLSTTGESLNSVNTLDNSDQDNKASSSTAVMILQYGEQMSLSPNILPYCPENMKVFLSKYHKIGTIYSSDLAAGEVILVEETETKVKFAAKHVKKNRLGDELFYEFIRNEMILQYSLSKQSENIVPVYEYYESEEDFVMIQEYSNHPDYFDDLLENRYNPVPNEQSLKCFAFDILNAIKEIHKNNIIHCDIKPQNFLLYQNYSLQNEASDNLSIYSSDSGLILKVSDFGLAHVVNEKNDKAYMKFRAGTMEYKAPEVKDNCYVDKSIDMWSFGVCLYKMAVAYFPTAIRNYKYGSGPIPFRAADWNNYEEKDKIKDLIVKCLKIEPHERITAEDALKHPWFEGL